MRERHPIDDRFNKALFNAESEPPEDVRRALAGRLGWNAPPRMSTWKPLLFGLIAIVGVGVAAVHFGSPEEAVVAQRPGHLEIPADQKQNRISPEMEDVRGTRDGALTEQASITPPDGSATTGATLNQANGPTGRTDASVIMHGAFLERKLGSPTQRPVTGVRGSSAERSRPTSSTPAKALSVRRDLLNMPGADRGPSTDKASASGALFAVKHGDRRTEIGLGAAMTQDLPAAEATYLSLRTMVFDPPFTQGEPRSSVRPVDYVLPNGTWWAGPFMGVGTVSGQWRGADVAELQVAEQWHGTMQAGLLVGREWRNNWGVSGGMGIARVRSTLSAETAGMPQEVIEVDTAWLESNHIPTGQMVYTWVIDSLLTEIPGERIRSDARNLYTAVQIPVTIHWHTTLQRFRLGAFGGITAWIPTQRNGLTLLRAGGDGSPTPLPLQDERVDDRFRTQVHGQLGLSLGYTITGNLALFAEPMITTPLLSFNGRNTPWLTRPVFQIRLQHAFRTRSQ